MRLLIQIWKLFMLIPREYHFSSLLFKPFLMLIGKKRINVAKKNIDLFRSLALHEKKVSEINNKNLSLKNLFSELGIFLVEKNEN